MQNGYPFRQVKREVYAAGTYAYVKTEIVPNGQVWRVSNVAYVNETGARGTFRRYIEGHGEEIFLAELQGPGSNELIFSDVPFYMVPGERLMIRQASCSASDVLKLYVIGEIIFTKEPLIEL